MSSCTTGGISWPSPAIDARMVSRLLWRGLLAGLLAGFCAATFSYLAGEPPLARALQYEEAVLAPHGEPQEPEVVSRVVQRSAGLFAAHAIYGAAAGGLFSLVFALCLGRLGSRDPQRLAAMIAALGFIALALMPDLKYPPNPPAVGAAGSIGTRTQLYFVMLAISLLAVILAGTMAPVLSARLGRFNGLVLSAFIFIFDRHPHTALFCDARHLAFGGHPCRNDGPCALSSSRALQWARPLGFHLYLRSRRRGIGASANRCGAARLSGERTVVLPARILGRTRGPVERARPRLRLSGQRSAGREGINCARPSSSVSATSKSFSRPPYVSGPDHLRRGSFSHWP